MVSSPTLLMTALYHNKHEKASFIYKIMHEKAVVKLNFAHKKATKPMFSLNFIDFSLICYQIRYTTYERLTAEKPQKAE